MKRDDFDSLPPIARAKAMAIDKPYRPSRVPMLIGVGVVAVLVVAVAVYTALREPPPPRPLPRATPGVVYMNLSAPKKKPVGVPAPATPADSAAPDKGTTPQP